MTPVSKTLRLNLNADLIEDVLVPGFRDIRTAYSRIKQGVKACDASFLQFDDGVARLKWTRNNIAGSELAEGLGTYDVLVTSIDGDDVIVQTGDVIIVSGVSNDPTDGETLPDYGTLLDGGGA